MASTENIRCGGVGILRARSLARLFTCRRLPLPLADRPFRESACRNAGLMACLMPRSPSLRSVYVRVRPLNEAEARGGAAWRVEGNAVFQVDPASEGRLSDNSYKLDAIFDGR